MEVTTSQLKSTTLKGMSGATGPTIRWAELHMLLPLQDGISSFYVLGGYSFDVSSDIDLIYRFDEDTYEFVELNQRLPYPASVVLGAMVTMDALGG